MIAESTFIHRLRKTKDLPIPSAPEKLVFSENGERLLLSFAGNIQIIDAMKGILLTKIDIRSNNADFFDYNTILTSNDSCLSYISCHDMKILRKFQAQSSIESFCTSSTDIIMVNAEKVYLYDIKSKFPINTIDVYRSVGTFIDENIFCVSNISLTKFFDLRNTRGPIKSLSLCDVTGVKFYNSNRRLVFTNSYDNSHTICDYMGEKIKTISLDTMKQGTFTPDGLHYVINIDGLLRIYNIEDNLFFNGFRDDELVKSVFDFNPVYEQMASASNSLRFWLGVNE
ncbi:hypothetical protein EDEG_00969 [Edhazardia aedis USNM 41457]|uniref:DUF2415 domain-containing protein n=1 Tax=Edhazardia aedis (strain USNM 41457) TaxID=1003232 RepID=J9DU56_EDHAE|nr:hypothetical protein EDEG_00969 [Edhazardia aedis USNM 41457]|eukprot:EJW04832.1 hypothetical protein EDEG_00969 [Edhazardia aedis USNM 41457]